MVGQGGILPQGQHIFLGRRAWQVPGVRPGIDPHQSQEVLPTPLVSLCSLNVLLCLKSDGLGSLQPAFRNSQH